MGWVGVSVLVRWLLGWLLALHLTPLPQGALRRRPRLSVLIPARNEAATLPLRVLQPPPLAPGWCGKTWALHHGVKASSGEVLVFLDADTEPQPALLHNLVAALEAQGGLV